MRNGRTTRIARQRLVTGRRGGIAAGSLRLPLFFQLIEVALQRFQFIFPISTQIPAARPHHKIRRISIASRIDDLPASFSGGMQQRLQIARNLVTGPRLVFMDEPTAGLDVSVQARLLDLLRTLTSQLQLSALVVTHDIGVARLLAHRLMVMQHGRVVEAGLTDQVLDDPQHPYTQLLVSSVLPV